MNHARHEATVDARVSPTLSDEPRSKNWPVARWQSVDPEVRGVVVARVAPLITKVTTEGRELREVVNHSPDDAIARLHFHDEKVQHSAGNMDEEVRLCLTPYEGMPVLVDLTTKRESKALLPMAPPAMIELVTIDALSILRLLGSSDW